MSISIPTGGGGGGGGGLMLVPIYGSEMWSYYADHENSNDILNQAVWNKEVISHRLTNVARKDKSYGGSSSTLDMFTLYLALRHGGIIEFYYDATYIGDVSNMYGQLSLAQNIGSIAFDYSTPLSYDTSNSFDLKAAFTLDKLGTADDKQKGTVSSFFQLLAIPYYLGGATTSYTPPSYVSTDSIHANARHIYQFANVPDTNAMTVRAVGGTNWNRAYNPFARYKLPVAPSKYSSTSMRILVYGDGGNPKFSFSSSTPCINNWKFIIWAYTDSLD